MARSRVQGAARLKRTLKKIPSDITDEVRNALAVAANQILDDAQASAPVRTGRLKTSLRAVVSKDGLSARIGSFGGKKQRAYHAFLVEFGTAAGERKTESGTVYWHKGSRAEPFLFPAYRKNRKESFARIKAATVKALGKASSGTSGD